MRGDETFVLPAGSGIFGHIHANKVAMSLDGSVNLAWDENIVCLLFKKNGQNE
jgi:hypothetical protein